ncbi:serine/threonine-protein kinase par-1-like [Pseudorasbora parva]|uniref:serine/threonine-protein kinase par-1-like n=1 Tax=Pseudorasbora parva TaxID=51549 RepID=UPI00351E60B1
MGQCRSHSYVVEQNAQDACTSARPAQEKAKKKKKGRFFRWASSWTSKKPSIDGQESQCANDENQQPEIIQQLPRGRIVFVSLSTIGRQQSQCTNDKNQQPETIDGQQSQSRNDSDQKQLETIDGPQSQSQCANDENQQPEIIQQLPRGKIVFVSLSTIGRQQSQCTNYKNQQPETIDGQESQRRNDSDQQQLETFDGPQSQSQCANDENQQPEIIQQLPDGKIVFVSLSTFGRQQSQSRNYSDQQQLETIDGPQSQSQCANDEQSQCANDKNQQPEIIQQLPRGKIVFVSLSTIGRQQNQCTNYKNQQPETIDGQESQSRNDSDQQQPETIDGQESQSTKDATQKPERCSDGESAHASDTKNALELRCVSFHTTNEGIDLSVDKAEQDSWVTCVSSLTPKPEEEKDKDNPGPERASTSTHKNNNSEENTLSASPADDTAWTDEEEVINLSLKGKTDDILQHYECLKLLGRGSYGQVFEGIRLSDSRKVALKYVEKTGCEGNVRNGLFGKSLPKEVAMMALLSKSPSVPQIVKLLDWYETPNEYILVLERPTPCQDMRQFLLKHGGRIEESSARAVMRQVVTAAKICCERGILHGDIKLENLLINENTLQVKLIDFGTSKRLKKSAYSTFRGTKVFAPPESVNNGKFYGKPATVYALGVVLFKMLSGKYPRTPKQLAEILTEPWYTEEISKECQDLISACMQNDPAKRIDLEKILLHDWFQALILN